MNRAIRECYQSAKSEGVENHCRLTPNCIGWRCKHLHTEVPLTDELLNLLPVDNIDKPGLFAKVYIEAKRKGVTECPNFRPLYIDNIVSDLP